jgi:hypothetical protein
MIRSRIGTVFVAVVALGSITILAPATHALAHGRKTAPPVFTSPPGMAYDEAARQVVLFGSEATDGGGLTWTWDGSAWSQRHPKHEPPWRLGAGMAYDAATQEVLLFGGGGHGFLGDTWTWDGSDWTRQHPAHSPSPRYRWAWRTTRPTERSCSSEASSRTTRSRAKPGRGTEPTGPDNIPGTRHRFDPILEWRTTSAAVRWCFSGGSIPSCTSWETHGRGTGSHWTQRAPAHAPSPRADMGMADDSTAQQVLLFGGAGESSILADTWEWDGTDWTQVQPPTSRSPCSTSGWSMIR